MMGLRGKGQWDKAELAYYVSLAFLTASKSLPHAILTVLLLRYVCASHVQRCCIHF